MPLIINNEEGLVGYMITKEGLKYNLEGLQDSETELREHKFLENYIWEDRQCILEGSDIRICIEKLGYSYIDLINIINKDISDLRDEDEKGKLEDLDLIKESKKKDKQVKENKAFYGESKGGRPKVLDIYFHNEYKLNSYSTGYLISEGTDHRTLKKGDKYIKFKNRYFKRDEIIENFKKGLTKDLIIND